MDSTNDRVNVRGQASGETGHAIRFADSVFERYLMEAQTLIEAQRLAHAGSWVWQVAGRKAVYLSEEWCRVWGFDPQDRAPTWEEGMQRIHPEDRASWQTAIDRAISKRSDYVVEFRILLPSGAVKYVHTVGHPVLDASGELLQFVGASMDVTERRRAEEERERLRQAQADLVYLARVTTMGDLSASLAHEIKQPISAALTNAKTCLQWLACEPPDVKEARETVSRIIGDVTRTSDTVNSICLLLKKDASSRELLDINDLIRKTVVLLRSEAARYSISIHCELAQHLPKTLADCVQLQQALMNLMLNGIEAMSGMEGGGALTIESHYEDSRLLVISVRDTGPGLQPRQTEQIFNAFFTTKPQGIGMGLPISQSIIESHGGRLWAIVNAGRGTTFQFTLPAEPASHGSA